jgi:hypothetical protein
MAHQASQIIIGQIGDIFGSNFKHAYQFFAVFGFLQQSMGFIELANGPNIQRSRQPRVCNVLRCSFTGSQGRYLASFAFETPKKQPGLSTRPSKL